MEAHVLPDDGSEELDSNLSHLPAGLVCGCHGDGGDVCVDEDEDVNEVLNP